MDYILIGTLFTASISLIGILLQYILPQKQPKPQEKLLTSQEKMTNAQRDNIISETYERLLGDVRDRLEELSKDIDLYRDQNALLMRNNQELQITVEKQGIKIEKYEKEIRSLKTQLKKIREVESKRSGRF